MIGVGWVAFSPERGCNLEWLTMVGPGLSMVCMAWNRMAVIVAKKKKKEGEEGKEGGAQKKREMSASE